MAALSEFTIAALLGGREHAQDGSPTDGLLRQWQAQRGIVSFMMG